eukprot:7160427-Pyramimonas_sp.AAC.1
MPSSRCLFARSLGRALSDAPSPRSPRPRFRADWAGGMRRERGAQTNAVRSARFDASSLLSGLLTGRRMATGSARN